MLFSLSHRPTCLGFVYLALVFTFWSGLATSEPAKTISQSFASQCAGALSELSDQGPISFFKKNHWAVVDTKPTLGIESGKPNGELVNALTKGYDELFERAKAPLVRGRFPIAELECCPLRDNTMYKIEGLPEAQKAAISEWANEVLSIAKAATGENLQIKTVTLGRGFAAGGSDTPLIHRDGSGTYIHALTTLQGPATLVFPAGDALAEFNIIDFKPGMKELTLKKLRDRDENSENLVVSDAAVSAPLGETAIITGMGYSRSKPDRVSTMHSSPPGSQLDRLTLFVDIQPVSHP